MFVFGDFNVHHKDWLTYSDGTDRHGELSYSYNYNISNDLTQMVNFPTRIPDCIRSTMVFPPLENSGHVVVSVSIDFPSYSKQDAPFHRIAYDDSRVD